MDHTQPTAIPTNPRRCVCCVERHWLPLDRQLLVYLVRDDRDVILPRMHLNIADSEIMQRVRCCLDQIPERLSVNPPDALRASDDARLIAETDRGIRILAMLPRSDVQTDDV